MHNQQDDNLKQFQFLLILPHINVMFQLIKPVDTSSFQWLILQGFNRYVDAIFCLHKITVLST